MAGYGPLAPVADESTGLPLLQLPPGFRYHLRLGRHAVADGLPTPTQHDGMGVVHADGARLTLVPQPRMRCPAPEPGPAAMTYDPASNGGTSTLLIDAGSGELLEARMSLSGTLRNCAGGVRALA